MIDVLELLIAHAQPESAQTDRNNTIHPNILKTHLRAVGVDETTIKDIISDYEPESWDFLLNYFEDKHNGCNLR